MTQVTIPRLRLLLAGSELAGVYEADVETTNYGRADSFTARVALGAAAYPTALDMVDPQARVQAVVQVGFAPNGGAPDWVTLIDGVVDTIRFDPVRMDLDIEGRSWLALLLDQRVQDGWMNKTSGEVLTALISAAGLTPDVQITGSVTGQYYQIAHKRSALSGQNKFSNAFDLARFLANDEGCDMWADGKTVHVVPALSDTSPAWPLVIDRSGPYPVMTVEGLSLERSLLITQGLVVQVLSWDYRQRRAVSVQWPLKGSTGGASTRSAASAGQLHVFKRTGLTQAQAQALAQTLYDRIIAHQRTVTVEMDGELSLTPRQSVLVQGTGTSWDGRQRIDNISRRISVDGGFTQTVTLRNRDVTEDEDG